MKPAGALAAVGASQYHRALVDSAANIDESSFRVDETEFPAIGTGAFSVSKETLRGGLQEGSSLLTLNTGKIRIVLVPTRGMGILRVESSDGVRYGWNSPVTEVVHPRFMNLLGRGGLGWLEGFNEFLVRCGLEYAGAPGPDTFVNNMGREDSALLTVHGKIANIPASKVELWIEDDPKGGARIRVRGQVREVTFLGPKLALTTELIAGIGSASFELHDTITNLGTASQEFQLIYHTNFGPPLLEEGSEFVAPLETVTARDELPQGCLQRYATFAAPTAGFVEEVFFLRPYASHDGQTMVGLVNRDRSLGASLRYDTARLPCLSLWKNCAAREDGYVTGIEPGTSYPNHRSVERKAGRVPVLKGGESADMRVAFSFYGDRQGVAGMLREIEEIRGGRSVSTGMGRL